MSLNKFSNTEIGQRIDLQIGCDELKANNVVSDNLDITTINGSPYPPPPTGIQNPLTADLKLGGFAIVEELASLAPSLNIDQLNPAKDLKLKVGGFSKLDVSALKVSSNVDLDLKGNSIENVSVMNNTAGSLLLTASSAQASIQLDANPSQGISLNASGGKSIDMVSDGNMSITSNSILDVEGVVSVFKSGGVPKLQIDAVELSATAPLNMNNNNINGVGNVNAEKILNTNTEIDMGVFAPNSLLLKSTGGIVGLQETTTTNNMAVDNSGVSMTALQGQGIIRNLGAGGLDISTLSNDIVISSGTNIQYQTSGDHKFSGNVLDVKTAIDNHYCNINMNNNDIALVRTINGIQPSGGLSAGLTPSNLLTASVLEQSILPNTFAGSRVVPGGAFVKGDSYSSYIAGTLSSLNGDSITIRLYGGLASGTLLSTLVVPLVNSSGVAFELRFDFTILEVGVAGVASLGINYQFSYQGGGSASFQGTRKVEINNTNFDTTLQNDLNITGQFSSASASNSIQSQLSTLTKTY